MHRHIFSFIFLIILMASPAWATSFKEVLRTADPQARYLFYLHGDIMETQGKGASSPRYGVYLYDHIIEHYEDRGLVAIEEVRPKVNPVKYAAKIVTQIRQLMAAGVPAGHITVAGFSKGDILRCSYLHLSAIPMWATSLWQAVEKANKAMPSNNSSSATGAPDSKVAFIPYTPEAISRRNPAVRQWSSPREKDLSSEKTESRRIRDTASSTNPGRNGLNRQRSLPRAAGNAPSGRPIDAGRDLCPIPGPQCGPPLRCPFQPLRRSLGRCPATVGGQRL